ncbi:pentatricopeptide repeat-containing At5g04810, chloroplastic [Olea europaea subsp. europaea]|uniref:Pentatricopeptide repeat-containing At5g04810, chloroplastic n=1 Tax=Olea europaea subsp. europaea TaxID=158383 RepID=A0A8S0SB62_OLEEU|nr:pentatricopeptide repeat-containing At5g04810, chloroplastic [Olea europaea subsp. europaea]
MEEEGFEMSLVTYSILVGGFAKIVNIDKCFFAISGIAAELWFKEAKEKLTSLNAIIYGNKIYANWCYLCSSIFSAVTAIFYLHNFVSLITPNTADKDLTWIVLKHWLERWKSRVVVVLEWSGNEDTSRTFMPIIHAFAKSGETRKALNIFNMTRRSGCIPTVHTFNALILGLVEKRQVLVLMSTHTTIMHGYASLGDTGKAFEYFSKVKSIGLELDVFTYDYEALFNSCCKLGRMQSALAVTKQMNAQNIP